jgi:hypothetical protein
MPITLDGTAGITTPEIISTGGPVVINASAPDNSMVMDASGNVGIGTASPVDKLSVSLDQNSQSTVAISNQNSGASAKSSFRLSSFGGYWDVANGSAANNSNALTFANAGTERMRIDASGRVTTPFQPAFIAKGLASQTTYTRNQVVVFNTVAYNVGSSYNTANGRFTAPIAGLYAFTFQLYLNPGNTNAPIGFTINGTMEIFFLQNVALNGIGLSTQISLAANDYVEVRVRDVVGGSATIFNGGDHTQFTGHLIG